jgi:hypothetical protein
VSSFGSNNLPVFIPGYRQFQENQFKIGEDLGKGGTATVTKAIVTDPSILDLVGKTNNVAIKYFSNQSETSFKFEVALMG